MSIKIITEPSVRLVGRLAIDEAELEGFLSDEGVDSWTTDTDNAGQKLVEVAGRLCYKSYAKPRPGGNSAYLGHILEVGHGSVIEHAVYNFIITGVSRSFTHELVRHRAGWAYSQRSQRFCDETDGAFVVPPLYREAVEFYHAWEKQDCDDPVEGFVLRYREVRDFYEAKGEEGDTLFGIGKTWKEAVEDAQRSYAKLAELTDKLLKLRRESDATARRKRAREAARSVLPNATETQIFVTVNARAARHFIEARGDEHADAEIRSVALKMLAILQAESPNLFGDYVVDPARYVSTPYRKV